MKLTGTSDLCLQQFPEAKLPHLISFSNHKQNYTVSESSKLIQQATGSCLRGFGI